MKVLLLADTYSEHTEKWALGLANNNIEVGLFSFNKPSYNWYDHKNITVLFEPELKINAESAFTKLSYIKYVAILKKVIKQFGPDILHAHYATSYGLIGALSGFKPFFLSVWGSDVYDFPKKSRWHKMIFQYNLKRANVIMSTSKVMMEEVKKYTNKEVIVTPFGVDLDKFFNKPSKLNKENCIYVGTIKPIEEKYGIEYIIEAAEILVSRRPDSNYKFLLIGPGNNLDQYKKIISKKKLENHFEVLGRIPFNEVVEYHNLLDIFLNVSIDDSESFGVAVVEAMACEKPVIVTDVGGLMEVVDHGEFGIVIPKKNAIELANAIEKISLDLSEAKKNGKKAREHVIKHYDWNNNLQRVINEYNIVLDRKKTTIH